MLTQNKKEPKKLKISELSGLLKIKKSTIKRWEQEFDLSTASPHLYSEKEILLFKKIKRMIHEESLSIRQVRENLKTSSKKTECKDNSFTPAQSTVDDSPNIPEENILLETSPSELTDNQNKTQITTHAEVSTSFKEVNQSQLVAPSKNQIVLQNSISDIKTALLSIKNKLAQ